MLLLLGSACVGTSDDQREEFVLQVGGPINASYGAAGRALPLEFGGPKTAKLLTVASESRGESLLVRGRLSLKWPWTETERALTLYKFDGRGQELGRVKSSATQLPGTSIHRRSREFEFTFELGSLKGVEQLRLEVGVPAPAKP